VFVIAEAPLLLFCQLEMTIQNGGMRELFEVHHEYWKKSYVHEKEETEALHQRLVWLSLSAHEHSCLSVSSDQSIYLLHRIGGHFSNVQPVLDPLMSKRETQMDVEEDCCST